MQNTTHTNWQAQKQDRKFPEARYKLQGQTTHRATKTRYKTLGLELVFLKETKRQEIENESDA